MLIELEKGSDDDGAFLFRIRHIASGAARFGRPRYVQIVKVDNWFGARWLRFAGTQEGEDLRPERLTLPPFAPKRVVSEHRYRRTGDRLRRASPHHLYATKLDRSDMPFYLDDLAASVVFVWYSGNTAKQDRGSLMVYDVERGGEQRAWYAELQRRDGVWTVASTAGTSANELTALETSYDNRLAPLAFGEDVEKKRLWEHALDAHADGKTATAAVRIDRYRERYPDDKWIRLLYAESLSHRRLYEQAERAFRDIEPNLTGAGKRRLWLDMWGEHCERRGDLEAAEAAYREAARLSDHTASWIFLGTILLKRGKHDEAEAIQRHATTLDGDPDEAYINLGFVLRAVGRYAEAIEAFEKALELDPDADVASQLADLRAALELRGESGDRGDDL